MGQMNGVGPEPWARLGLWIAFLCRIEQLQHPLWPTWHTCRMQHLVQPVQDLCYMQCLPQTSWSNCCMWHSPWGDAVVSGSSMCGGPALVLHGPRAGTACLGLARASAMLSWVPRPACWMVLNTPPVGQLKTQGSTGGQVIELLGPNPVHGLYLWHPCFKAHK